MGVAEDRQSRLASRQLIVSDAGQRPAARIEVRIEQRMLRTAFPPQARPANKQIGRRHHKHGEQERRDHSADHRRGDPAHDFRPGAAASHDRQQAADYHGHCHGDGPHSQCRAFMIAWISSFRWLSLPAAALAATA